MLDQVERGVAELGGVVRRDRGRHADGDAGGAVGEQVGEGAGQDDRLVVLVVVGGAEIDGVLVDPLQQERGDLGQARLGVAVGGGVVAVDRAEIALAVDQLIALREILGEAHHGVVDRLVAVGVELADHLADDGGAFLVGVGGIELEQPHRMQDAPLHRLQPVARVGQRAVHDRRQGIGEVALLQRRLQADVLDALAVRRGRGMFAHCSPLQGASVRDSGDSGQETLCPSPLAGEGVMRDA